METNIFCMNCGTKLPAEAKFCFRCGQEVSAAAAAQSQTAVAEQKQAAVPHQTMPVANSQPQHSHNTGSTVSLGAFREMVRGNGSKQEEAKAFRKGLAEKWDYNAVAGILIGSRKRHVSGPLHELEQNIGIGQGDNKDSVTARLNEKGLEGVFAKYEKNTAADLRAVEQEILAIAPEYREIVDFINRSFLSGGMSVQSASAVSAKQVAPVPHTAPQQQTQRQQPSVTHTVPVHQAAPLPSKAPVQQTVPQKPVSGQKTVPAPASQSAPAVHKTSAVGLHEEDKQQMISNLIELMHLLIDDAAFILPMEVLEKQCKKLCQPIQKMLKDVKEEELESLGADLRISEAERLNLAIMLDVIMHADEAHYSNCFQDKNGEIISILVLRRGSYRLCVKDLQGMEAILRLLTEFGKLGYGEAFYVIGLFYGRHTFTYATDQELRVYKPDFRKMLQCYSDAATAERQSSAAMLALGCNYMAMRNNSQNIKETDETAKKCFAYAAKLGEKDAEIYLKNYDRLTARRNRQRLASYVDKTGEHVYAGTNCIEYEGYLYFLGPKTREEDEKKYTVKDKTGQGQSAYKLSINRVELTSGRVEEIADFYEANHHKYCIDWKGMPRIAILGGYIYYMNNFDIWRMRPDGSEKGRLEGINDKNYWPDSNAMDQSLYVFPTCILYRMLESNATSRDFYKYDFVTKKRTKFCGLDITAVSDKEIILKNKIVKDLATGEERTLGSVYPGTKKKKVLCIDAANEIAYHIEEAKDGYSEARIIGTDKNGEIVDLWKVPSYHIIRRYISGSGTSSLCFNGDTLSVKVSLREGEIKKVFEQTVEDGRYNKKIIQNDERLPYVSKFDRFGNELLLHESRAERVEDNYWGIFHHLTENTVCFPVHCSKPDRTNYQWTSYLLGTYPNLTPVPFEYYYFN